MSSRCPSCGGIATTGGFQHEPTCPQNPWRHEADPDMWDQVEAAMRAGLLTTPPLERIAAALERIATKLDGEP